MLQANRSALGHAGKPAIFDHCLAVQHNRQSVGLQCDRESVPVPGRSPFQLPAQGLIRPHTEEPGRDEELQGRSAAVFSFQARERAFRQFERFGRPDIEQLPHSLRQARRVADQTEVFCVRNLFQPLVKLRIRSLVQQSCGKVYFGRAANRQNNFRRLSGAHERAAVNGIEFDAGPLQKPSDRERFLPAVRREGSGVVVSSLEGISVAQEVKFHDRNGDLQ